MLPLQDLAEDPVPAWDAQAATATRLEPFAPGESVGWFAEPAKRAWESPCGRAAPPSAASAASKRIGPDSQSCTGTSKGPGDPDSA